MNYPDEEDVDLGDKSIDWLAIYDADNHPTPKDEYVRSGNDPYKTLAILYNIGFIEEDRIAGLRFKRTFKSDQNDFIGIPHSGDEIESISFNDSSSNSNDAYILWLFDSKRTIHSGEKLELFIMPMDNYYIQDFSGSITVTYIAYPETYRDKRREESNTGSTPIWKFLGIDTK